MNLSKELNLLPDDSHILTALINKTYDVAKNLIDEHIFTKAKINRLEQKLKDSENKYQIFIENFPGIAFQGYQDFLAAFFDGNIEEMTGYTEEDFTSGRIKWDNIIHPDDLERIIKLVKKFHSTSMNSDIREYRIIHKNGTVRWFREYIKKLYDNIKKEEMVQGTIFDITESKLTEEKLRESEERYRLISENTNSVVWMTDMNLRTTYISPTSEKLLGYTAEESMTLPINKTLTPNTIETLNKVFKEELKIEKRKDKDLTRSRIIEVKQIHKNGAIIDTEITITFLRNDNGDAIGILGVARDITKRKKIEEALQKSKREKSIILDSMTDIVVFYDNTEMKITWANKAAVEDRDLVLDQVIGNYCYRIWHQREIPCDNCPVIKTFKTGQPQEGEIIIFDGNIYFIKAFPVKDENGNIMGVVELVQNITDRKKTEKELKKAKVFSESVLNSLPGIFYLFDEKGKFLRWNKNFEEVSECSTEEISKMNILDFFKGEDKKHIAERIQEVFIKGKSTAEADFISKSGKKTFHYFTGLRIIINDTTYLGGMGIDISERKKAEKKLQESEKRYRDFISVASHEFKTPLIPIIGIPQLILKDTNLTEQQKDFINEILLSGKKLNKLMDNILDTTKIDAKSIELTKREMEINPLINSCISDLAFLMKHNSHTIIKRLKENVKLNIDDKKISRVLTNLILNAIKYTPQNGKIEISTQIDAADNFIFSIKDNGIGIDKKDADLVFQKFRKIRGAEISQYALDTYGTGLGLFISKEIIKLHGGEIWFESEGRNNGTTFNFKLPLKDN